MSPEPPAGPLGLDEGTRCEWCGADYAASGSAATPPAPARTGARVSADEPATHCEWCGAE
jgi:hypothetical protein